MDGRAESDRFGYDVALSRDGRSIVSGAYDNAFSNQAGKTKTGAVYVYRLDESVTPPQWVQFGADYQGESNRATFDRLGMSVATSQNGSIIAAGALHVFDRLTTDAILPTLALVDTASRISPH